MTLRAVLIGDMVCGYADHIRKALTTDWELRLAPSAMPPAEVAAEVAQADAVIANAWTAQDPPAPRLRLFQVGAAGTDAVDLSALPPHVPVCNAFGHDPAIGEYVVMTMLAARHQLLPLATAFRDGRWHRLAGIATAHRELAGSEVLIVGTGRIGRAIGQRAAALGCRVTGLNRTLREAPPGFAAVHGLDALDAQLPQADFVVLACALDASTRGMLDARRLGLMKPDAVVVNVARGPVVDEEALYAALAGGRLGGAILDVWWIYPSPADPAPRPSRLPFHELGNVIMTPHCSGWTDGLFERRSAQMAENLNRLARGLPLTNVVRPAAG